MSCPVQILLADDHVAMRRTLKSILEQEPGFQIAGEATDGRQAVTMAEEIRPDVILMDTSMPEVNGIEATRLIAAQFPQIRIIGLTMYADRETTDAMIAAGAVRCVDKAAGPEPLVAGIRG